MPQTFSRILLHIVFSTKHREPRINADIQPRLYDFIGGIVRSQNADLLAIGGVTDHIHMLIRWNTQFPVGDLVRNIKARSSLWLNKTFPDAAPFAWQSGYGAFSVSDSQATAVVTYIERQREHHQRRDFLDEFEEFLQRHHIDYKREFLEL